MIRAGKAMARAVFSVTKRPGKPMLWAAEWAGANGSRRYGYQAVWRAVRAGLIRKETLNNGRHILWPIGDSSDGCGPLPAVCPHGHNDCAACPGMAHACAEQTRAYVQLDKSSITTGI